MSRPAAGGAGPALRLPHRARSGGQAKSRRWRHGVRRESPALSGKTLLDMAADDYSDPRTRLESRRLMRQLIAHHLGGKSLQSRRVFIELQEL
jgi:recombinational DNA repair protein (RecF pathway)